MAEDDISTGKGTIIIVLIIGMSIGAGVAFGYNTFVGGPTQSSFSTTINIKGSDTLLELASLWAVNYTSQNPLVTITVSGGGSGTGIAALINGQVDIADASRQAKTSEVDSASAVGVTLVEHVMVIDGIGIVTNPSKPIWNITFELLRGIYNGSITDWSQVNASYSGTIVPYGRQSTSGTYGFFQEHVMENDDYAPSVQQLAGNSDIINAVANDANGIGYVGAAYIEAAGSAIHVVRVNDPDNPSNYYLPTNSNIRNFDYPIARYLYCYTNGAPTGFIQAYINWCQGPQGQEIAEQAGYVAAYPVI